MRDIPGWLAETLGSIESSHFGDLVRLTPMLYPVLMAMHVFGISLLVGAALAVDLRLLGVGRRRHRVTALAGFLLPLARTGFAVVLITGVTMFFAVAATVGASAAAPWKFGAIALAGINILVFHRGVYRSVEHWDIGVHAPLRARLAGAISAVTWTLVIFAGRFLAY